MRYIGNKTELVDFIEKPLVEAGIKSGTMFDVFAGTTAVGRHFKRKNWTVISNDNMTYSYAFQKAYIENNNNPLFTGLKSVLKNTHCDDVIAYLNRLPGSVGFFTQNFSRYEDVDGRNFFSVKNAKKIDAIRDTVEGWWDDCMLTDMQYHILLCAIIEAIPSVSNISGTYAAYLKFDDPRMHKRYELKTPAFICSRRKNKVHNTNSCELVSRVRADVLYIDPPYNHRQYPTNYHLWESLAVWDKKINQNSTAGLRDYEGQKSEFCSRVRCTGAFEHLIKNADCDYILFSYNSDGIMSESEISGILSEKGHVTFYRRPYRRFKSNSNGAAKPGLDEWLFFVKCR